MEFPCSCSAEEKGPMRRQTRRHKVAVAGTGTKISGFGFYVTRCDWDQRKKIFLLVTHTSVQGWCIQTHNATWVVFDAQSQGSCCCLTCVCQKHALSTKAGYGACSSHAESPSCPRGQNWHHTRGWCLCCRVSPEHLAEHQGCVSWNNFDTVLAVWKSYNTPSMAEKRGAVISNVKCWQESHRNQRET